MTGPSQAPSPYLPPGAARGCAYCLDPDSQLLRQALTAPPPAEHAPIPTGALLDDLRFLHQLMRKQCAGYPDLLRHRDFDPDAFFAQWADTVRRAGAAISCRDGIFDEEVESVGWPVDCYLERIDQDAADLVPHLDSIGHSRSRLRDGRAARGGLRREGAAGSSPGGACPERSRRIGRRRAAGRGAASAEPNSIAAHPAAPRRRPRLRGRRR